MKRTTLAALILSTAIAAPALATNHSLGQSQSTPAPAAKSAAPADAATAPE